MFVNTTHTPMNKLTELYSRMCDQKMYINNNGTMEQYILVALS